MEFTKEQYDLVHGTLLETRQITYDLSEFMNTDIKSATQVMTLFQVNQELAGIVITEVLKKDAPAYLKRLENFDKNMEKVNELLVTEMKLSRGTVMLLLDMFEYYEFKELNREFKILQKSEL